MKKVLFVVNDLNCGGIRQALQSIVNGLSLGELELQIYTISDSGNIPKTLNNVKVFTSSKIINYLSSNLLQIKYHQKIQSIFFKLIDKLTNRKLRLFLEKKEIKKIANSNFDCIVAFSEGGPTHFVSKIEAKKKVTWLHCDFKSYLKYCSFTSEYEKNRYKYYDYIICVSNYTANTFIEECHDVSQKVHTIYNILDTNKIKNRSYEFNPKFEGEFNIVWVGRIDPVKRPSVIPSILKDIIKNNPKVHCYIIGPNKNNQEFNLLNQEIKKFNLERNIHLLGEKSNPYPYIKNAKILLNTSVSEACPYVINEAKILGTPIVCSDFGSAKEFISYGENGFYAPVKDIGGIINNLLLDKTLYDSLKSNLLDFNYDNNLIIKQIISVLSV